MMRSTHEHALPCLTMKEEVAQRLFFKVGLICMHALYHVLLIAYAHTCTHTATQATSERQSTLTLELSKHDPSSSDFEESQLTTTTLYHHDSSTSGTTTTTTTESAHHDYQALEIEAIRPSSASPVLSTDYVEMLQTPGLRMVADSSKENHTSGITTSTPSNTSDHTLECPTLSLQRQQAEYNPYYNVPELRCQEESEKKGTTEEETVTENENLSELAVAVVSVDDGSDVNQNDCDVSVSIVGEGGSGDSRRTDCDDEQTGVEGVVTRPRSRCSVDSGGMMNSYNDQPTGNRDRTVSSADSAN